MMRFFRINRGYFLYLYLIKDNKVYAINEKRELFPSSWNRHSFHAGGMPKDSQNWYTFTNNREILEVERTLIKYGKIMKPREKEKFQNPIHISHDRITALKWVHNEAKMSPTFSKFCRKMIEKVQENYPIDDVEVIGRIEKTCFQIGLTIDDMLYLDKIAESRSKAFSIIIDRYLRILEMEQISKDLNTKIARLEIDLKLKEKMYNG